MTQRPLYPPAHVDKKGKRFSIQCLDLPRKRDLQWRELFSIGFVRICSRVGEVLLKIEYIGLVVLLCVGGKVSGEYPVFRIWVMSHDSVFSPIYVISFRLIFDESMSRTSCVGSCK